MKHLYMLLIVCLYCTITTNAQTKYWIGPGGNWNDPANWSNTQGGSAGSDVPNGASYNVVINQDASIIVDISTFSLNSLTISNNATVRLYTSSSSTITLLSTLPASPALHIVAGSTLEDSITLGGSLFSIEFGNDAQGLVDGTWTLSGAAGVAQAVFPGSGFTNLVTVNGTLKMGNRSAIDCTVPAYLSFGNGSRYWVARSQGNVPNATWDANATLLITGITTGGPTWNPAGGGLDIGHLVIDCPSASGTPVCPLPNNLNVKGNLQVLNTNGANIVLGTTSGGATINYTVQGNVAISPNANITLGGSNMGFSYAMQVNGDFTQTGGDFNLRNNTGPATASTILRIKGNINQTGGTIGCTNTTTSTSTDLFVVELNGTLNQNLAFASPYILDNAGYQIVLAMNNSAGATLQTSLSVGKVSWEAAGKGNITTGSNVFTVRNPDLTDTRVVNGASDAGYVNGAVARLTASNTAYIKFPTGKNGKLREAEIKPVAISPTTYSVEYFNSGYGGSVQAPLTAVSSAEYWNIGRISGSSDATVKLTLAGAVPGAGATDTLVVAHHTGGTWTDVRDTKLTPGNSTTGSLESTVLSSFSPFTFGYASNSALPIYLVNFTARKEGSTARLNWTITENSTPQKFEVLRSASGSNFTTIGTVIATPGKLTYDFTDGALPNGTVYYRLRMIDIDGSGELTKVVAVMNGSKGVVITSMMPTLVTNRARLNISSSEKVGIQLVVSDIYGRSVKQQVHTLTNGNQELWLDLTTLPTGSYQVTGYLATGEKTSTIRFIKQ